jgi:hypothetical protein
MPSEECHPNRTFDQTKSDLALAEVNIKTSENNLKLYKERFEAKLDKEVAFAKRQIADKFLMLGFAEEYANYQTRGWFCRGNLRC